MRYLSLFSGIGGFELGIQQAYEEIKQSNSNTIKSQEQSKKCIVFDTGASSNTPGINGNRWRSSSACIGYSEIDKYACQVYNKHFNHKNYGDITKIKPEDLPDFDLVVGGFPCQSFSIAGKRSGFKDTRGTLFFEIARIIKQKQPRLLLLENVKGLLSHDKGKTFKIIISTLDELGYDCQWQVLNSKNFGVPQNRERVFIIGHLRGTSRPEVFPIGETDNKTNEPKLARDYKDPKLVIRKIIDNKGKVTQRNDGNSYTLTGSGRNCGSNQGILEDTKIRRLTPKECERLQGFPDDWTKEGTEGSISDTQRYKMCGNAVTVNVIKEIIKKIIK